MSYRAERRMLEWLAGLDTWAMGELRRQTDRWEQEYLLGVSAAAGLRTGRNGSMEPGRNTLDEVMGFDDANALIRKVVAFGDAPAGDYRALLEEPYSQSIAG
jgi:hypothetical protein